MKISALVILGIVSLVFLAGCGSSASQPSNNQSAPTITTISPTSAVAGGAAFMLTINGTNFLSGAVVNFGGTAGSTTFVGATQLAAAIPAAAIASAGAVAVTVTNTAPGGGTSNAVNFMINTASSGTFTPTGSMTTARAGHTATFLPDGRVLIFGGVPEGSRPLAEVYDPSTGMFTAADDMITSRGGHPAVLLADGKLLFLGGIVLQDGRVFFVGTSNAEIYDPASETFAPTGPYADANPEWDTTTLLLDGRVLLAGCAPRSPQCSAGAAELFDPQNGIFSLTGPMQAWSDTVSAATLLMNGTVLLLQATFDIPTDGAELYDPATGKFTNIGRTIGYHAFSAVVRLADGTVLITGGQLPGGNGGSATELYLPATRSFVSAGNMTTGRDSHTATLLTDGTVLIAGGISIWGPPPHLTASAEIYKPARSGPQAAPAGN